MFWPKSTKSETEPNRTEPPDAHPTHYNNQINGHTDNNVDDTSPSKNSHRMKPTPRFSLIFPHQPRKKKKKKKKKQRREYTEKGHKDFESLEIEMACTSQSMISANSCSFLSHQRINLNKQQPPRWTKLFSVSDSSSSSSEEECNVEECAPEKEVGKVSMEWLAGEKTRVAGTFPPKKRGWTGYVEKDTAGQTNIYSIEPSVYVAESVVSSGSAGTSSEGADNTAAIAAGLALISIAAASSILLQVDKKAPQIQNVEYSGPPLSYYINEFKPATIVQAATEVTEPQSSPVEAVPSETLISSEGNAEVVVPEVEVVSKEVEAATSSVSDGS